MPVGIAHLSQAARRAGPAAAPSGLAAVDQTDTTISLAWTNGDSSASTKVYLNGSLHTTVGPGVTTFQIQSAADDTQYSVYLRHVKDSIDSSPSATITPWTRPKAPIIGTAVMVSSSSAQLTWTNTTSFETRIYRDGDYIGVMGAGITSFTDSGLFPGTYTYTVAHYSTNSGLRSPFSSGATVDTSSYVPPSITLDSLTAYPSTDLVGVVYFTNAMPPNFDHVKITWQWRDNTTNALFDSGVTTVYGSPANLDTVLVNSYDIISGTSGTYCYLTASVAAYNSANGLIASSSNMTVYFYAQPSNA